MEGSASLVPGFELHNFRLSPLEATILAIMITTNLKPSAEFFQVLPCACAHIFSARVPVIDPFPPQLHLQGCIHSGRGKARRHSWQDLMAMILSSLLCYPATPAAAASPPPPPVLLPREGGAGRCPPHPQLTAARRAGSRRAADPRVKPGPAVTVPRRRSDSVGAAVPAP